MSFDYGSNDRDRDRDHSDRRGQGGHNNERDGGYSGGRTAVHDSYERDRENAREAGYDESGSSGVQSHGDSRRVYSGTYGDDERSGECRSDYGNDNRRNDEYASSPHNLRNEREGDYGRGGNGSRSTYDSSHSRDYQQSYSGDKTSQGDYSNNARQGYGDSGHRHQEQDEGRDTYTSGTRRSDDASNNSASAAYHDNNSRDSHTGSVGLSGGAKSGSGAIDWQVVGTQVAVAGIQHFAKSYDKSSAINKEEQRIYDEADGAGGSQAKESAFAKKLGERMGETEKSGHETTDLKDKLVEGGLGFLKGAFGGRK
ncbi:hypothetical protein EV426DRAFT_608856 [Tirmania nivea]|nr:hypothetical protein EV426DRAFT_608856 [Tirmania nivea]